MTWARCLNLIRFNGKNSVPAAGKLHRLWLYLVGLSITTDFSFSIFEGRITNAISRKSSWSKEDSKQILVPVHPSDSWPVSWTNKETCFFELFWRLNNKYRILQIYLTQKFSLKLGSLLGSAALIPLDGTVSAASGLRWFCLKSEGESGPPLHFLSSEWNMFSNSYHRCNEKAFIFARNHLLLSELFLRREEWLEVESGSQTGLSETNLTMFFPNLKLFSSLLLHTEVLFNILISS